MIGGMKCETRNHGVGYIHCSGATGCYLVTKFIGESYTVSGSSMHPTFQDRNKVIVSKISKSMNHIDNGDVVVFHEDSKRDFIKRVIGTPGDTVEYKGDQLYVNNKKCLNRI